MRLETISRSPLSTVIGSTLSGLPSIRAYNKEEVLKSKFFKYVCANANTMSTFHLTSRAFAFFLNVVNIFIFGSCLLSSIAIKSP